VAHKKPFLLRIDEQLHDELRRWAADDLRSLNGQIEFLLRRALKEWRGKDPGVSAEDGDHAEEEEE
jgi:hypothetical protein